MEKQEKLWFTSSSGEIEFQMTLEQAESVTHQGQCDEDCKILVKELRPELNKIEPKILKEVLDEYGVWDDEQLENHEENLIRLVWIAGGDHAVGEIVESDYSSE